MGGRGATGEYERQITFGSQVATLAIAGLLMLVAVLPPTPDRDRQALVLTALLLLLFAALWYHLVPRSLFGKWHFGAGTTIVLLIIATLLALTGGSGSAFFPYFLAPILAAAFATPRATVLTGGVAVVIDLVFVASDLRADGGELVLARDVAQLFAIATIAIMSWLIAVIMRRTRAVLRQRTVELADQNRELAVARAATLTLARARERDALVRGVFECAREPLGADLVLLLVAVGGGFRDGLATDRSGEVGTFETDPGLTRSPGRIAIDERRTVVVRDVAAERTELSPALRERLGVRSGIFVPLFVRDQGFGLVIFAQKAPRDWTAQDVRIAEVIAEASAAAVASYASYEQGRAQAEELAERSRVLEEINRLVDALSIAPDERATAATAARSVHQTFRLRAATTLLIDPSLALLETAGSAGDARSHPVVTDPASCPAIRSGRLFIVRGPTEVAVCPYMPADGGPYACMPLAASGSPLGALFLEPDERSIVEDSFVRAAADRVSLTIANRRLLETARRQATTDELTGLFNRRFMDEQLRLIQALAERHGEPYSIVTFDLDSLKDLNDALGHDAGDQGLRSFARILSRTVRTSDIAVRTGGDEFVILAPRTGVDEAVHVAERVREAAHAGGLHEPRLAVTVSAGVASWQPGRSAGEVLSLADAMLYEAKRTGRDRVVAQPAGEPSQPA